MPNCRIPPPGLGICTPRTGCGRYVPSSNEAMSPSLCPAIQSRRSPTVIPSTPGGPSPACRLGSSFRGRQISFHQTFGQGSCLVGRRGRLWLLEPGRSDAVVAVLVVARSLLVTFEVEGHLVGPGLLPLRAHRVVPDCSLARKIRPFVDERMPITTALADFSHPVPPRCRGGGPDPPGQSGRSPRVSRESFARASPDLPSRVSGVTIGPPRPLPGYPTAPALYPVSVRRVRGNGIGFLQIPPRGGHPCLALRFRSSRPAEDLHLQDSRQAWRTIKRPAEFPQRASTEGGT